MFLDQVSLLTAIGFSGAALTLTVFVSWFSARSETYLLSWGIGLALVVLGVVLLHAAGEPYNVQLHAVSLLLIQLSFAFIYAGALQYRGKPVLPDVAIATAPCLGLTLLAFCLGYNAIGTGYANAGMAILMGLAGLQYWLGRREVSVVMLANAVLYLLTAVSFALCAMVLLLEGQAVLTKLPTNWAEDLNAIVVIIGLTGIGAMSLTLNHSRSARRHRHEAMTDPLTGLLNRRALFDAVGHAMLPAGSVVIMFDLDHFKAINDQHGHAGGDAVLRRFGQLVEANSRQADTAARLGGEEFCLVLCDLDARSPCAVAERIRASFEAVSANALQPATVSAGVAVGARGGEAFEELLRRADAALYKAKEAGRNRVCGPDTRPRLVA
ncbi:MAG: hypothetical protein K0R85_2090 [Devosia sp.]|jgi:diguanylate cyclase (GGDEF)-like protein|nr:hypothetical protein [Devosia sp.]